MKKYFLALLIALPFESFVNADMLTIETNAETETTTETKIETNTEIAPEHFESTANSAVQPIEQHNQRSWENFQTYAMPSSFLSNMGFSTQANCAIALMKSQAPEKILALESLEASQKVYSARDRVFEKVIQRGMHILNNSGLYTNLSDESIRALVYQNLLQADASLSAIILLLEEAAKSEQDSTPALVSPENYREYYLNSNCASEINYVME